MDALLAAVTTAGRRHWIAPDVSYTNSSDRPAAAAPPAPTDPPPANPPPADPALPVIEPPVIEPKVFAHTATFLPPETVTSYLRTILTLCETLLHALHEPDAVRDNAEALAKAAHTLAGSAGMFGFQRLANLGQRFERALQANSPEANELAKHFANTIKETHQNIQLRIT